MIFICSNHWALMIWQLRGKWKSFQAVLLLLGVDPLYDADNNTTKLHARRKQLSDLEIRLSFESFFKTWKRWNSSAEEIFRFFPCVFHYFFLERQFFFHKAWNTFYEYKYGFSYDKISRLCTIKMAKYICWMAKFIHVKMNATKLVYNYLS